MQKPDVRDVDLLQPCGQLVKTHVILGFRIKLAWKRMLERRTFDLLWSCGEMCVLARLRTLNNGSLPHTSVRLFVVTYKTETHPCSVEMVFFVCFHILLVFFFAVRLRCKLLTSEIFILSSR